MRSTGLRNPLVYCGDYKCAHSVTMNADQWSVSDLELLFVCQVCGHRGADARPLFDRERMPPCPVSKRQRNGPSVGAEGAEADRS